MFPLVNDNGLLVPEVCHNAWKNSPLKPLNDQNIQEQKLESINQYIKQMVTGGDVPKPSNKAKN